MILKNDVMIVEKNVNSHFSKIASMYNDLRMVDLDHIQHIKNRLSEKSRISIVNMGCGDEKYSFELLKCLQDMIATFIALIMKIYAWRLVSSIMSDIWGPIRHDRTLYSHDEIRMQNISC